MDTYITADEAMQLFNELIKSGKSVTQDAVEEIISRLTVVDEVILK